MLSLHKLSALGPSQPVTLLAPSKFTTTPPARRTRSASVGTWKCPS